MKCYSLEAIRGIAAVLVVLHHSYFFVGEPTHFIQNSMVFVDFFFILSGFVMALAYQDKINKTIKFKNYFLLRFGRIYPLQLFMLLVWVPYIALKYYVYSTHIGGSNPLETSNLESFLSNLFLLQGLGVLPYESWNFPSWSISVEFFTYIIFFIYVVIMGNKKRKIWSLTVSIGAYLFLTYLFPNEAILRTYDYGILRCVGGFFIGVFIYNFFTNSKKKSKNGLVVSLFDICIVGMIIYFVSLEELSITYKLFTILSFALAVYHFASYENGIISKIFLSKPFQLIGKLSYSIYMVHAILVVSIQNIALYLVKSHIQQVEIRPGIYTNAIVSQWSILINVILVAFTIYVSYYTNKYVEEPWRKKFRLIVDRREALSH